MKLREARVRVLVSNRLRHVIKDSEDVLSPGAQSIGEIIAVRILFYRITYKAWVFKLRPARLYYAARSSICELRICYNP